jgi:hypothetical protein
MLKSHSKNPCDFWAFALAWLNFSLLAGRLVGVGPAVGEGVSVVVGVGICVGLFVGVGVGLLVGVAVGIRVGIGVLVGYGTIS